MKKCLFLAVLFMWIRNIESFSLVHYKNHHHESQRTKNNKLSCRLGMNQLQKNNEFDWQDAAARKQKRKFEDSGGILYQTGILTKHELSTIRNEISSVALQNEQSSTVARNRMGAVLPPTSKTVEILKQGSIHNRVQQIMSPAWTLSDVVPVELRVYEKQGAGMEWHVDDVLYDPPQIEVVLTLENVSDCITQWKPQVVRSCKNTTLVRTETDANSILLLRAGGVEHAVTPLSFGRRVILKFVYIEAGATLLPDARCTQFTSRSKTKSTKRKHKQQQQQRSKRQ
eukprot:CAMPEP_0118675876 /NCGR_PEP_ID=MMETSP0800-20121206/1708_1 /TAXON_ID=210618 ORGANISM="Striatella unipunctata, Strain CCMP2910" /NCGR_SAMPLE_ID=MMETSP0800 /ASSEMBLY_ACC=CAM_ASM_000638 /LENGTH=283 /DNA_ID=CAMNT_0006571273 /DNA_START=28 /DNA_END=879 /DNA_ORIENTATION=-